MNLSTILLTVFYCISCCVVNANGVKLNLKDLIAQEKGRVVKKIVLDAGHGGNDPGTHGKSHKEKDLTLDMTLMLGKMINNQYPQIEVLYTRTKDEFIPLHERIGFANKVKADLFISIHCNYVKNSKIKGTETFVMGLHRADDNLEVAKRENQSIYLESDFEDNYDGFDPNSSLGYIMLANYQDAYLDQSIDFAHQVEKQLYNRDQTLSRGVKQAGFAVLRRATMPSVLIEAGFLSNANEEKYLGSEAGQKEVCTSIVKAISNFMETDIPLAVVLPSEKNEVVEVPKTPTVVEPKTEKYYVQIAAKKQKSDAFLPQNISSIGDVKVVFENQFYKYQIGGFASNDIASQAKMKLVRLGFDGAFLIVK